MLTPLNLNKAPLELSRNGDDLFVRCIVRNKKLLLTPEEWVRQHIIYDLILNEVPLALIGVEVDLTYNRRKKRADIVVYDKEHKPAMIVECKAPSVAITEKVFQQLASYNFILKADYFMLTNGLDHVWAKLDKRNKQIVYLERFPKLFKD